MKISKDTLAILKSFATINEKMLIPKGNLVKVINDAGTLFGMAEVSENFECPLGIYDMNKFLSILSFFKEPEFNCDPTGKYIIVESSDKSSKYKQFLTPPELLEYQYKDIDDSIEYAIECSFPHEKLELCQKMAAMAKCEYLSVQSDGEKIVLKVCSIEDTTADTFETYIDKGMGEEFDARFLLSDFRFLKADYKMSICKAGMARLDTLYNGMPLTYLLGVQPSSTFES